MPLETRQLKNLKEMPPTTPSTLAHWSKMTNDVRRIVVGHLDYGSRCSMKLCSKSDYYLVNMTKFKANNILIRGVNDRDEEGVHIGIDSFSIWFIKKDNTTEIERGWNGEKIEKYKEIRQEDHYDRSRRFLDKYHQKFGMLNATSVHIVMVSFSPSPNWKIKCDNFEIFEGPLDWLNASVSRKYKSLEIFDVTNLDWAVDERMLEATDKLNLISENDMTDDQLGTVKATDVWLHSNRITTNGLIKYLDYFIKNGKKTDRMKISLDIGKFNYEQLMEFLEPKSTGLVPEAPFRMWMLEGIENVHGVNNPRGVTIGWPQPYPHFTVGCYVIDDKELKKIEEDKRKQREKSMKQKKNKNNKKKKTVKRKKKTQKKKKNNRRRR
ncbi:hypothetical protein GCK72_001127 [Caenorhabditis remanei]|uniref:F-box domain-containing protein n=1 Tax=Caenorhabditis remanei TaxID=31234 RepID=A0A6A5HM68_CAERE|nr:hypothetical protein GCK72_001127 [Caenorhabditis remanei]KAF1769310.1 hypothetical protein GCK72_001127 [Caenorhabditis remanei]